MKNNFLYLTGDLHGDIDICKLTSRSWEEGNSLTKNDYVIILGDFGLLWNGSKEEKYWLNWLTEKPWTTLFIDGNHCNFNMLNGLPIIDKFSGKVGKVNNSIYHLKRGEIYTISGAKFFCMGGAKSIDKIYRKENISWWKEEEPNWRELNYGLANLEKHNFKVDYILGHTTSNTGMRLLSQKCNFDFSLKNENLNDYFEEVCKLTQFKKFYFGHFHVDMELNERYHCLYHDIIRIK